MKRLLVSLAVVLVCVCAFNVKAANAKKIGDIGKEMLKMGFLRAPVEVRSKDSHVGYKFYQKNFIFVVGYVFDSRGRFDRLIFEFWENVPRGLAINLINDILNLLGQPDSAGRIDLLSDLITCRQNNFIFFCGSLEGTVSHRNFSGLPLRKIEFINE